jgi:RNA polymerase sigma-70 factor (ECF subfamily)
MSTSVSVSPRKPGADDVLLARRLAAGDESAFDSFFADYFPRLFRFACSRLGGKEDEAEDVVQATLVSAVRKIQTYRGEAALFTWLCTICRREIGVRRERAGLAIDASLPEDDPVARAALDTLVAGSSDPGLELDRLEEARLVQATLDHLPGRYGDALKWKYMLDLSVEQIASRLGVGYKAAESLLARARQAFREAFRTVPQRAWQSGRGAGEKQS